MPKPPKVERIAPDEQNLNPPGTPEAKKRSKYWFARIDGEKDFLRQKCEELSQCIDVVSLLAAYHTGKKKENPHVHICVELNYTPQKQTFAVRLKDMFRIVQKTQYALELWDSDKEKGAPSYMYHEDDAIVLCTTGFTQAQLDAAQTANAAVQKVVAMNQEKSQHKLIERALEEFKGHMRPERIDILEFMLTCIHKGENYHPGTFMLKRYVEEVELKLLPGFEIRDYALSLADSLWR